MSNRTNVCPHRRVGLVIFILAVKVYYILAAIPDYIHICNRDDPLAHICINNSIEALRTKLAEGIPELDVPPIEPLIIPTIGLRRGTRGAEFSANMSGISVWGCSSFRIDELKTDLDKNIFDFKLTLPKLKFSGKYSVNTNVLFLKISGKGDLFGNFNYKPTVSMRGYKVQQNNQTYLKMGKMTIKIKIGSAQLKLTNLFNGDPVLGEATNRVINENSKLFLEEIRPALEEALSSLFTDISNKITLRFTYDELFPLSTKKKDDKKS
uniref:Circadian clock-controlled protein n=1 Tax=Cacopsylla melanoneura TaxID=428564 RepID=A0A8D8PRP8_9HEMI